MTSWTTDDKVGTDIVEADTSTLKAKRNFYLIHTHKHTEVDVNEYMGNNKTNTHSH